MPIYEYILLWLQLINIWRSFIAAGVCMYNILETAVVLLWILLRKVRGIYLAKYHIVDLLEMSLHQVSSKPRALNGLFINVPFQNIECKKYHQKNKGSNKGLTVFHYISLYPFLLIFFSKCFLCFFVSYFFPYALVFW